MDLSLMKLLCELVGTPGESWKEGGEGSEILCI